MPSQQTYIMQDQVKDLVSNIMGDSGQSVKKSASGIGHLAIFALFTSSYILSIALSV